jgi:hypothetical protein
LSQEARREQSPDSYLSTSYDLQQYSISATDIKTEFLTGFGKFFRLRVFSPALEIWRRQLAAA